MEEIMGSSKTTTNTSSQTKATPTPEETRLNQLEIERTEATQPGQIQTQLASQNLINMLLAGGDAGDLPGFFGKLGRGIDPQTTQTIVDQSLQDIGGQFQGLGILDSGTMQSVGARTAGDIRAGAEQFNIGSMQNLLNLAFGGQAQVQQPLLAQSNQLGNRLAGLRSINQSSQSTQKEMNPFMQSFQSSLGKGFGKGTSSFLF